MRRTVSDQEDLLEMQDSNIDDNPIGDVEEHDEDHDDEDEDEEEEEDSVFLWKEELSQRQMERKVVEDAIQELALATKGRVSPKFSADGGGGDDERSKVLETFLNR